MGPPDSQTVPCHYCGIEIEVPPERTRFEMFTAHFESEHIRDRLATPRERQRHEATDQGALADGAQDADD